MPSNKKQLTPKTASQTPWKFAATSEHSQQVALFMWANRAEQYGFDCADDEVNWSLTKDQLDALSTNNAVPELRWLFSIPNGGERNAIVAGNIKAEGVKKGVYDIFWPLRAHGCGGLWIEMKKPGSLRSTRFGTFKADPRTQEQQAFGSFVEEQEYYQECCDDWWHAAKLIEWYYHG